MTRFYFSSSADLLDILSKGNQPLMVAKHLTKLFDSMAKLLMEEDGEGKVTNTAHTMVAKDGEKVVFKVGLTITLISDHFQPYIIMVARWRVCARARWRAGSTV